MSNHTRTSRAYFDDYRLEAHTNVDGTRTYTTTSVELKGFVGIGVSKRFRDDPVDFELGKQLALARALRDLADSIERRVRA